MEQPASRGGNAPGPQPPPGLEGVVYQIYPRSFRDTSGDGVGDLEGIRRGMDHLAWLGVDAVWLSPIYPSPMADFGYDVADHCDVDPVFGTLEDVDRLIADAHDRDIEVWLDWVPNHTSDRHPWFQASRSSRDDPRRDWYVWRDPAPDGGPPNNWVRHFADHAPAWTFDEATGQYYLHQFLPEQPDVNWANPELRAAMLDVLRFWMDRGIDGFRADVVHLIGKDPSLPDDPPRWVGVPRAAFHHVEETHAHLREIRATLDAYPGRRMVGEINLLDPAEVATYVGPDQLHLAFHFGLIYGPWEAERLRTTIQQVDDAFTAVGAAPTWVLGNHDSPRIRTRVGGDEAGARAAALLLLSLRGTAFLYAGEELGLEDAEVPSERVVDPGGRDGCRAPVPWTVEPGHGWVGEPWLPWPPDAGARSVEALVADEASILHLHRRLLAARRTSPALRRGAQRLLDVHPQVVAVHRRADGDQRMALVNLAHEEVPAEVEGSWLVEIASDGRDEQAPYAGRLGPRQGLLLRSPA